MLYRWATALIMKYALPCFFALIARSPARLDRGLATNLSARRRHSSGRTHAAAPSIARRAGAAARAALRPRDRRAGRRGWTRCPAHARETAGRFACPAGRARALDHRTPAP